ncbi:MAG: radical SAM protein [Firmicutes bacterium]|nr:radical SAM protein [Bacillota bacterium]
MGGEPLDPENIFLTDLVISNVKEALPDVEIYLWTGYKYETLQHRSEARLKSILDKVNVLIDGEYIKELRDITQPMIGSTNQRILTLNR